MRILVLGSAAGGGVPQWNCLCPVCRLAWSGDKRVKPRSQSSLAVSADGERWLILNASPDLRQQIIASPCLHPRGAKRHSPIGAVFVTNADVDHLAGLLTLREQQSFVLLGSPATLAEAAKGIFGVLNKDLVSMRAVALDTPADTGIGVKVTPFAVPGKVPLYLEGENVAVGAESEATVGVELSDGAKSFFYVPGCAEINEGVINRLAGAALAFFDGTTFTDDEMVKSGLVQENRLADGPCGDERRKRLARAARVLRDRPQDLCSYQQYEPGSDRGFAATRSRRACRLGRRV